MSTLDRYLPAPEVVVSFWRGLTTAALLGGQAYVTARQLGDNTDAILIALSAFFASLLLRMGEGTYDAARKQPRTPADPVIDTAPKILLTGAELDIIEKLRSGQITYDPEK